MVVRLLAIAIVIAAAASIAWTCLTAGHQAEAILFLTPPARSINDIESRLVPARSSILSDGSLRAMLETKRLYEAERPRLPEEDLIGMMRRDISVAVIGPNEIRVRYVNANAEAAVRGCRELMDRLVAEDTRLARESVKQELQFAEDELARARKEASRDAQANAYLQLASQKVAEARWNVAAAQDGFLPRLSVKEPPRATVAWRGD